MLYLFCWLMAFISMFGAGMLVGIGRVSWQFACLWWELLIIVLAWIGWVIADKQRHLEAGRRLYRCAERRIGYNR